MMAQGYEFDPKNGHAAMLEFLLLKSGRFSKEIIGNNYYSTSEDKPQFAQLKQLSTEMSHEHFKEEGNPANLFPNVSYLIVRGAGDTYTYYTVIANRYYEYINYLRLTQVDGAGRVPKKDWMTIFPGISANYPGKIYLVDDSQLSTLIEDMKKIRTRDDYKSFDRVYGLQKMSTNFWAVIDRLQTNFIQADPIHNGAIDLGDYGVHDLIGSP